MEQNINEYQKDYDELVVTVAELKEKKEQCNKKITKANSLITGLNAEKVRWEQSSNDFVSQFESLTGNVLISSAFLTYIGFFG